MPGKLDTVSDMAGRIQYRLSEAEEARKAPNAIDGRKKRLELSPGIGQD